MALRLQQGVRSAVHHHGRRCHGDDSHAVANTGLQAIVPLVVGHRQQTWVEKARKGERSIRTVGEMELEMEGDRWKTEERRKGFRNLR